MDVHDLLLNAKEHKFYKKYKGFLEKLYDLKILIPDVLNSSAYADIIFGTIVGTQQNIESANKFISKKLNRTMRENIEPNGVTVVTLSDSEDENTSESESENSTAVELHVTHFQESTKETVIDSKLEDDSICIIENEDNPNEEFLFIRGKGGPNQASTSARDSIKESHEEANPYVSSVSLDQSVCIIDNPCHSETIPIVSKNNSKRKRSRKENMKDLRQNEYHKVSQQVLPSSSGDDDPDICEVSSTTDDPVLKRPRLGGDPGPHLNTRLVNTSQNAPLVNTSQNAPQFIALFQRSTSGIQASYAKYTPNISVQKEKADDITLVEPEGIMKERPVPSSALPSGLRPIVIDGSNVARTHGNVGNTYSSKGIQLCIDYFVKRGHTQVVAFVPHFRRYAVNHKVPTTDVPILEALAKTGKVVFTPSRKVNGQCYSAYDDRFIVKLASENGGVIVSNDNFKDLIEENETFKEAIEGRLLMYCFVGDMFMVPEDPLGRNGPTLNEFLTFPAAVQPTPQISC